MLDHLAVGEPLPLETLVSLCGAEGVEGVTEVERAGLAVVDEGDGLPVRLSHPLYAEQLRAQMSVAERRALTARLARAFEHAARHSRPTCYASASWQLESGGHPDAPLLTERPRSPAPGSTSRSRNGWPRDERSRRVAGCASLALGWVLIGQGRTPEALAVLDPHSDDGEYSARDHADIAALATRR